MAGCCGGFSCGSELITQSVDPLDMKVAISPDALATALEKALLRVRFRIPGVPGSHKIVEAHVCRVGPTLTSIRQALGMPTPWVGPGNVATHGGTRKTTRRPPRKTSPKR